jgi:hypothetical protein
MEFAIQRLGIKPDVPDNTRAQRVVAPAATRPLHPAGRPATADEIVEAIVFLAQSPPSTAGRAAI